PGFGPGVGIALVDHVRAHGAISGEGLPGIAELVRGVPDVAAAALNTPGVVVERLPARRGSKPNIGTVPTGWAQIRRRGRSRADAYGIIGDGVQRARVVRGDSQPSQERAADIERDR